MNGGRNLICAAICRIDNHIRMIFINGTALCVDIGVGLRALSGDAAKGVGCHSLLQRCDVCPEIDNRSGGLQAMHYGVTENDAAAGGHHSVRKRHIHQDLLLDVAKALVAMLLENFLKRRTPALLYGEVGIAESQAAQLGENHADGALADAGHADKTDGAVRGEAVGHGLSVFSGLGLFLVCAWSVCDL